ncbi:hypothetical protein AMECASPLE_013966 [Ameca splendens]|uniref:Uncharacterized protein n=1 Tax=Ameca splendens TaxID=208324 RepID=A0ABV0XQD4_9TELE
MISPSFQHPCSLFIIWALNGLCVARMLTQTFPAFNLMFCPQSLISDVDLSSDPDTHTHTHTRAHTHAHTHRSIFIPKEDVFDLIMFPGDLDHLQIFYDYLDLCQSIAFLLCVSLLASASRIIMAQVQ